MGYVEYTAGGELISELYDLDFEDVTAVVYPEHYAAMDRLGCYKPNSIKRAFRRGRVQVRFDYIHIYIEYMSTGGSLKTIWDGYRIKKDDFESFLVSPKYYLKRQ